MSARQPTVYIDRRDWWVGYYRGDSHHYVCPLPTVVIRWARAGRCVCGQMPLRGGTVELAGVKHRLDGPCYLYGVPFVPALSGTEYAVPLPACAVCGSENIYYDHADGWCCLACHRTDADE